MQNTGLDNDVDVAYFKYDFAKHGGVVSDIKVYGDAIPNGAIIRGGIIDVIAAVTSSGSATVAIKAVGAGDILAATAKATLAKDALIDVVPVSTALTSIRLTADLSYITVTPAVAALTAGVLVVALQYVRTR